MQTIVVDPDDMGVMAGNLLPPDPDFVPTPIRACLDKEIPPEGECYLLGERPCLLFGDWDYAEDWSGEFIRETHPFAVAFQGRPIREQEWRDRVARSFNQGGS